MSLSSLFVQREIATIREVEEALARQVLYGGDLVTNLLEVARLDEGKVTPLLAESFGMTAAPPGELAAPSDAARKLVPSEMASGQVMIPLVADGARLVLAVAEPLAKEAVDELSFALGLVIEQQISPSFRIKQAISRAYEAPLERRVQRLLARIAGDAGTSAAPILRGTQMTDPPRPPPHAPAPRAETKPEPVPEPAPRAPAPASAPAPAPAPAAAPAPAPAPASAAAAAPAPASAPARSTDRPQRSITSLGFPAPPSVPPPPVVAAPPAPPEPEPESWGPPTRVTSDVPRETLQRSAAVSPRPTHRRRGPLTPDAAKQELEEAEDRDAILDLFFDFTRQFFDYAALFLVQADVAEGRDSFGDGAPRGRVVAIAVPLDLPSLLATTRERRAPVLSPPSQEGLDRVLLADLDRKTTGSVLVVPVVVRKRAVALLFGDSGDAGVDEESAKTVIAYAAAVGQAFERIIVRKKLQGFRAGDAGATSHVDRSKIPSKVPPSVLSPRAASAPPPVSSASAERLVMPSSSAHVPSSPRSEPPPPENISVLRRPSGRPIPREDPPSIRHPDPASALEAQLRPSEQAPSVRGDDRVDTVVIDVEEVPRKTSRSTIPPGPSSQAVSIPAHRPPSSRTAPAELPSVIVDVDAEFAALVERFVQPRGDEHAEAELLRQGHAAMPAIMAHFPGPIRIDPERLALVTKGTGPNKELAPRVNECGPILRIIAGQRRVALPFVLSHLDDDNADNRFWATFLLTELVYAESVEHLVPRLFDDEPRTRRVARLAARAVAEVAPSALIEHLGKIILASTAPREKRVGAIDTLSEMREPAGVPVLVGVLADTDDPVGEAAHRALVSVTHQDFGQDQRRWMGWWSGHASRHRIEWLIDALMHDEVAMRHAAGEELKAITKEYFGYYDDLPKRERERAQQRYRDWWSSEGRVRFRK